MIRHPLALLALLLPNLGFAQSVTYTCSGTMDSPGTLAGVDFAAGDPFTVVIEADTTGGLVVGPGSPNLYRLLSASIDINGVTSTELDTGNARVVDNNGGAGCQDQFGLRVENDRDFLSVRVELWAGSNPCPTVLTSIDLPVALSIGDFNVSSSLTVISTSQQFSTGTISTVNALAGPTTFPNSCIGNGGDQMGCTDCPCGNDSTASLEIGGCLNSAGESARLHPFGSSSIASADLRFEASGVPATTAVLTSGNALAPANAANPCFGANSGIQAMQLDGLRCVVQGILRHGVRPSDSNGDIGFTTNGWGTPNGFFNFNAFTAGQTKHFQIIYRDDESQVCMRGQNTSQAISVSFQS